MNDDTRKALDRVETDWEEICERYPFDNVLGPQPNTYVRSGDVSPYEYAIMIGIAIVGLVALILT